MSKKKTAPLPAFPEVVFVRLEDDGDGTSFLVANESSDTAEHDELVARYTLVNVAKMRVTRELV